MATLGSQRNSHQVHTITSTADKTNIADRIQGTKLIERQTLVHEVYRHEIHSSKPPIDAPNKLINGGPKILVLFDILSRRNGQLSQDNLKQIARVVDKLMKLGYRKTGGGKAYFANPFGMLR